MQVKLTGPNLSSRADPGWLSRKMGVPAEAETPDMQKIAENPG